MARFTGTLVDQESPADKPFTNYGGFASASKKAKAPRFSGTPVSGYGQDDEAMFGAPEREPYRLLEEKVRGQMVEEEPVGIDPQIQEIYDEFPDYTDFIEKKLKFGAILPDQLRKAVLAEIAKKRKEAIDKLRSKHLEYAETINEMDFDGMEPADIEEQVSYLINQKKVAEEQKKLAEQQRKEQEADLKAQTDLVKLDAKQQADLSKEAAKAETAAIKFETAAIPNVLQQPTLEAVNKQVEKVNKEAEFKKELEKRYGKSFVDSYEAIAAKNPTLAWASTKLRAAIESGDESTVNRIRPIVRDMLRMQRLGEEGTAQYEEAMSNLQKTADALGYGRAALSSITFGLAGRPIDKLIETVSGVPQKAEYTDLEKLVVGKDAVKQARPLETFSIGEYQSGLGRAGATGVEIIGGLASAGRAIAGAGKILPAATTVPGAVAQRAGVQAGIGGVQATVNSLNAVSRGEITADEAKANIVAGVLSSAIAAPIAAGVPGKLKNAVAQVAGDLMVDLASDAAFTDYLKDDGFVDWFLTRELPNLVVSAAGAGIDLKGAYQQKQEIRRLVRDGLTRTINLDKGGGIPREVPATAPEASRQALAQQRLEEESAQMARTAEELDVAAQEAIRRGERAPTERMLPERTTRFLAPEEGPAIERGAAPVPPRTTVTLNKQEYALTADDEWVNTKTNLRVKSKAQIEKLNALANIPLDERQVIQEKASAIPIRETETIPVGEGAEGRAPMDQGVREQAAPEDQIKAQEEVVPKEGLIRPGSRVNITMMEGGGTYTIERVNPDGTVDVRDQGNRPMQVRRTRIYGLDEPKPRIDSAGNIIEARPSPAPTPEATRPPGVRVKAEDQIKAQEEVTPPLVPANRKELQSEAKRVGVPSTGTTKEMARLVDIAKRDPSTWTREEFDAISPYLSVHQVVKRSGQTTEELDRITQNIAERGLTSGMVDPVESFLGKGRWSWANELGDRSVIVFSKNIKYRGDSPNIESSGKPIAIIRTDTPIQRGSADALFEAIRSGSLKKPEQPITPTMAPEAPISRQREEVPVEASEARPLPGVTRKSGFIGVAKQKPSVQVTPSADPDVRAVNDALDRQQKDFERSMLGKGKKATDAIAEGLWDSQALAKRKLIAADMKEAEARLILRRGWAAEARAQFDERLKNIDRLITHGNEKAFSEYIEMRRLVEVSDLKAAKGEDYDLPYGITPEQAKKWVAEFEAQKSAEGTLSTYKAAADEYYKAAKDQLDAMRNEGLLSQEAYDSLVTNHKNYSPQQMIQYLDPEDSSGLVGKGAGAPIKGLKGGSESGRVIDYRYLMARTIAAAQNRIFSNRANKALVDGIADPNAAKEVGAIVDDGSLDRVPFGYKRIKAFEDGKEKAIFAPEEFAKAWDDSDPVLKKATADFLRTWSGSRLIKAQATGYNPEFIISNFPRDAAYAWFRTDEYSPILPIGAMQQAKDYIDTAKDAFSGKGLYREYLKEGGGLDGLSGEGRLDKNPWDKVTPTTQTAKALAKWAGYLGEVSERWTRLSVYNRALKNGKSPMEAAKIARDMLDFAQGGKATKMGDTVIPYLNAATQGTRGLARAFTENGLGKQSFKAAQVMAIAAGLGAFSREYFKEQWDAISDYEKASKWIIPLPKSFAYTDDNGRTRYRYLAIAKDQGQGAFAAIADSMVALARGEKVNGKAAMQAFLQAFPDVSAGSPIANAMQAYFDNYDTFRKEDIYKGRPTTPSTEFSDVEILDKAAEELSRISGGAIEISPLRLKRATEKIILPHNPLTMLTGLAANEMLPKEVQTQFAEEAITRLPFIRRFIRSTPPIEVPTSVAEKAERLGVESGGKPGKAVRQEVYEAERQVGAERNRQDREIRRIMSEIKAGAATKQDLLNFIKEYPDEEYTRLRNRIKTIQEEFGLQLYIPQKSSGVRFAK